MDDAATPDASDFFVARLRREGEAFGAVMLALYEVGHTYKPDAPLEQEYWTGQVYLVGAWTKGVFQSRPGELQGLPAALQVRVCPGSFPAVTKSSNHHADGRPA